MQRHRNLLGIDDASRKIVRRARCRVDEKGGQYRRQAAKDVHGTHYVAPF
jgi:hypothetical protein